MTITTDDLVSLYNRAGGGWPGMRAIASFIADLPQCRHGYAPGDHHYEGGCPEDRV